MQEMYLFNQKYFPNPDFKYQIQQKLIDEKKYTEQKEKDFLKIYISLVKKYNVELSQSKTDSFLDKWYCYNVRKEIDFAKNLIQDDSHKKVLEVILSRTIRSCRATTHYDLATLKEPQLTTYYCWKHKKICKPIYSIKYWYDRYANDTLTRLQEFDQLRKSTQHLVLNGDSRFVNIETETKKRNKALYELLVANKIRGIFSSPPYVGQIDYHEQHAYAYDLFGFERKDEFEIGPLSNGQGSTARQLYVDGISDMLNNCKKYLQNDYDVFLVANDKFNLYSHIAQKSGMQIVNQFKRPVLNRTERDRNPYSEIIFHFKTQ